MKDTVMFSVDSQSDRIYDHLGDKPLGMPMRGILIVLIEWEDFPRVAGAIALLGS